MLDSDVVQGAPKGETMRARLWLGTIGVIAAITSVGCYSGKGKPLQGGYNLPPAPRIMEPGPGVGGPGPGVIAPVQALMPIGGNMQYGMGRGSSAQLLFVQPQGMQVRWDVGTGQFDSTPLVVPGRNNFAQGAIYRIKITNIPGRAGVELYPTIEVGPASPRSEAFLAHNAIPVQFSEEDFDQVLSGNFVTKVIYLPDPEFQELALAGIETLVSTRLDPGLDPIVEADRRGAILAIIRLGNKDFQVPGVTDMFGAVHAGYNQTVMLNGNAGGNAVQGAPVPQYVSGVNIPQYGMPYTGTPIGLPGPPHIPLGAPAGLQRHVMANHTRMDIPDPTRRMRIDVRQSPGLSYPQPVNHIRIDQQSIHPTPNYRQPWSDRVQLVP